MSSQLRLAQDNVLILDEPTNHLDLESIIALGDALAKYEGTTFVVTHDRDLISSFATRIFAFTGRELVDWPGSYEDYVERAGDPPVAQEKPGPARDATTPRAVLAAHTG